MAKITGMVSRRQFLRTVAVGSAGALLAACQPQVVEKVIRETVEVEKVVEVQVAPEGELVVRVLLDAWMCDLMALLPAVQRYNEKYKGKIRIEGDRTPTGWETKVLQMVREGKPYWDARWHMTQFFDMRRMVETGLIQPIEDYVEASSLPWAGKYEEMTTPPVYESGLYKGHRYGLSDYVSRNVVVYRTDYLQEAGWEKPPDTWEEFNRCAHDIKDKLGDKGVIPINPESPYRRFPHSAFLSWVKDYDGAYDAEGKVRFTSDEFIETTKLFVSWFDEGLTDSIPGRHTVLRCLGFLKGSHCPHYDGEPDRCPAFRRLIAAGKMSAGIAADDGVALHYVGARLAHVVSSRTDAAAYKVRRTGGKASELKITPRYLGRRNARRV